jgi:hypothetical protein
MAGTLTLDTLKTSSGVFATQNAIGGISKAWVNFYGMSGTSIRASFNVSSVTRNSSGNYTINFTTAMSDGNYVFTGSYEGQSDPGAFFIYAGGGGTGTPPTTKTTTQCRVATTNGSDAHDINALFIGS